MQERLRIALLEIKEKYNLTKTLRQTNYESVSRGYPLAAFPRTCPWWGSLPKETLALSANTTAHIVSKHKINPHNMPIKLLYMMVNLDWTKEEAAQASAGYMEFQRNPWSFFIS